MKPFIIQCWHRNSVEDSKYVRILKDETVYIILESKVIKKTDKEIKALGHLELDYLAKASLMVVSGSFGFMGIDYKLPAGELYGRRKREAEQRKKKKNKSSK